MKMLKSVLIDPFDQSISEVVHEDSLAAMYKLMDCKLVEAVHRNDRGNAITGDSKHYLYVDEEGMYKVNQQAFIVAGKMIMGRALVRRADREGNDIDATICSQDLKMLVRFPRC
jgi:hypothetical protein